MKFFKKMQLHLDVPKHRRRPCILQKPKTRRDFTTKTNTFQHYYSITKHKANQKIETETEIEKANQLYPTHPQSDATALPKTLAGTTYTKHKPLFIFFRENEEILGPNINKMY